VRSRQKAQKHTLLVPTVVIRVARSVSKWLAGQGVPHALVGGLAVCLHGHNGTKRMRDLAHVVELLKLRGGPIESVQKRLSGADLERFRALVTIATLEKAGNIQESRRVLMNALRSIADASKEHLEVCTLP